MLQGGSAIPFPVLKTIKDNFDLLAIAEKAHTDAVDAANHSQELLTAMLPEAIAVVKKVWDEVETHYNEGTQESKRKNARQWGVVYTNSGNPVPITGHIMELVNGAPVPVVGAKALIADTEEEETISISEGAILLKTNATGLVTITFSKDGFANKIVAIEINNSNPIDLGVIVMERMVR